MPRDDVQPVPPRPQVTLLRFSLRKMLTYVGVLCVLFAGMAAAGGLLSMALLLVVLVGGAHVLSTFVGTRLRDGATERSHWEATYGLRSSEPYLAIDQRHDGHGRGPAAQQLQGRGPVVWRRSWLVAGGSLIGAGGGLWLMVAVFWPQIAVSAIVAGCVAAAILGGWIAFLAASFYGITRRAWREAVEGGQRPISTAAAAKTAPEQTLPGPSPAPLRR